MSYDRWLESPYTDEEGGDCSENYCSLCWTTCKDCVEGEIDGVQCVQCEGEGSVFSEQVSESEHRYEYEASLTPEDK